MPNTLMTPTWVVNETAERFMTSVKGVPNFNRSYDDQYRQAGAKVGSTVLARLPQQFAIRRGQAYSAQALYDRTVPLTLSYQTGVDFDFSSAQATTEIDRVRERYVNPAADTIAADADAQGMADIYFSIYNSVGTPGTTPSTNLTWLQAKQKIFDGGGDTSNLVAVLDSAASITLVNANIATFNPAEAISKQWKTGMIGMGALGIREWYEDQNVPRHTTGTFTASTPVVNGASQTGSTININGWASGATSLKKGDIFSIAGVFSVNPLTKVSTGRVQQFTITADTSDSTGTTATLPISPSIVTSGALQTVSASPASGAAVTVWAANPSAGTLATTVSPTSMVFNKNLAAFVMADLANPVGGADASFARSRDYGLSIRFVRQFDVKDDSNAHRLDILFGAGLLEAWQGSRVVG